MSIIIKKLTAVLCASTAVFILAGCDKIGQTPPGGSNEEVKAFFDKQPLDVRAKQTMGSPAPMDVKIKQIKEMYKKEGKEVPPDLLGGGGQGTPVAK